MRTGEAAKPWVWADMHPVARLKIPRIGYDEYVLDNAAPRTLAFGPGIVANGAVLGEDGNLAIAGHRTSWFLPLKEVRDGDQIELEWFDAKSKKVGNKEYVVKKIEVVDPTDSRLLRSKEEDGLTLITCYPFGYGAWSPQRYVVRAKPASGNRARVNE
jgi:sortase A